MLPPDCILKSTGLHLGRTVQHNEEAYNDSQQFRGVTKLSSIIKKHKDENTWGFKWSEFGMVIIVFVYVKILIMDIYNSYMNKYS